MTKTCRKCGQEKPVSEFSPNSDGKNTYPRSACKVCEADAKRAVRKENGEHVRSVDRKRLQANPDKRKQKNEYVRAWRKRVGPQAVREGDERSRYGTTRRELGSACAVCGSTKHLCIDHDHQCCSGARSCGKCVRDVLCVSCNTLIGKLESNPGRLAVVKGYLTLWDAKF